MKIGILGGSFNPIHNGHIKLARLAKETCALDEVLFMVASNPPHKPIDDGVSAAARYRMTELALCGISWAKASDVELNRQGKSYTVDTVKQLLKTNPTSEFYLIVGEDMLENLPTWYSVNELTKLIKIIVAARPGAGGRLEAVKHKLETEYGAKITLISTVGDDVSSTTVRENVKRALPISHLVPENVEKYIYRETLYRPEHEKIMQEKLSKVLNIERYEHTLGTVQMAIHLAEIWGVDANKARIAALLHDCAKSPKVDLLSIANSHGVSISELERNKPSLLHDKIGAILAAEEYGIADNEIIQAVAAHSLGRVGMTMLEKVVFMADKVELGRTYDGIAPLRKLAMENIDKSYILYYESLHLRLKKRHIPIIPEGKLVYDWFLKHAK